MDTLRQLAQIPQGRFQTGAALKTVFSAQAFASGDHTFTAHYTGEFNSMAVFMPPPIYNMTATFTLVCIPRNRGEKLTVGHDVFMNMFKHFKIERRFLHLVKTNRYGLHYNTDGTVVSYYIGTALYTIMWSFDVSTRETKAILLSASTNASALDGFYELVRLEAANIHSPFLLAWATLVHLSNWMDNSTFISLNRIRKLEKITGYGPFGAYNMYDEVAMGELTKASKTIGSIQVELANQIRHIAIGSSVASHLTTIIANSDSYAAEAFRSRCKSELEAFSVTVPLLRQSLSDSDAYVSYLQERVKSQSSVGFTSIVYLQVFSLMTHEDARISAELAKASKDLAEAAKKDSSSMKTIAVMTMLFLPGTYFAALWAVPSLQWGQPGVIQDDFWVYWAFTLPCTIAVFAVWLWLHRWRDLSRLQPLRWMTRMAKRNNTISSIGTIPNIGNGSADQSRQSSTEYANSDSRPMGY
ncbi:hypothetical protein F4809DRAFT_637730 [Biscogniauxia mediterranea]|nr:hypothetical protein F4809DRAFT_637730 [Biscogniauxia mediterranea]